METFNLDTKGLQELKAKYTKLRDRLSGETNAKALAYVAEKSKELWKENYGNGLANGVGVRVESNGSKGVATVYNDAKGAPYYEFGTGIVGRTNPYPDSPSNEGYEWEYMSGEHVQKNPMRATYGGWYFGKWFTRGQPAHATMFNTKQQIREYIPQWVVESFAQDGVQLKEK